jgi:benzodiazapine receptor
VPPEPIATPTAATSLKSLFGLAGWLVLCFGAAAVGARFMPGEWYAGLKKPSWNPPGWIFAPVWTALYTMMAVAAWLIWKRGGFAVQRTALLLFLLQLFFNALWSWLFFGRHQPALAFVDILLLWLSLLATTVAFWRINNIAGLLLVPYLLWVSFAAGLNFALWRLNR